MSPDPDGVREVALATVAIGAVGVVSLIILFRSARSGARIQGVIAAGLAALSAIVVVIFCGAAAVRELTRADAHSTAYAAVWVFAGYVLTLFAPLAPALLRYSRRRAQRHGSAAEPLPEGLPRAYWLVEATTIVLVSATILASFRMVGIGTTSQVFVVVPLCLALPAYMRATVGRRFYGRRLLAAAQHHTGAPEDLAALQTWTDETASTLGAGTFTVLVLPVTVAFVVPLGRGAHLVAINPRMYASLDPPERRALVAHEMAHTERADGDRRALLIMGVTLWLFVLIDWWAVQTRQWPTTSMLVSSFVFITILDHARRTLSHRAEFAADRRAVEIVDDRQAVVRMLMRFAQGRGRAAARDSRSHPSLEKRIQALQS